MKVTARVFY